MPHLNSIVSLLQTLAVLIVRHLNSLVLAVVLWLSDSKAEPCRLFPVTEIWNGGVLVWRSLFTNLARITNLITRSPCPCKWGPQTGTLWYRSPRANIDERLFVYRLLSHLSFLPIIFDGYTFFTVDENVRSLTPFVVCRVQVVFSVCKSNRS